jgi:uncharacterized membrane protein YvbJ
MEVLEMKECPKCHSQVNDSSKFCNDCGYEFKVQNAKNVGKKKGKVFLIITAIVVAVALLGTCIYFFATKSQRIYNSARELYENEIMWRHLKSSKLFSLIKIHRN